jgi:thymidylate synthase
MSEPETPITIGSLSRRADVDSAFTAALRDILSQTTEITQPKSLSVGSEKKFKEILNYNVVVAGPRQRLVMNPKHPIKLPGAVARFVWMMAANNRLKDIEFYWGKAVTPFSDDGIIVQGSSYGERMLHPRPGLNQVEGVISRLKEDPTSRRAAISIYQAEDAVRDSKDIPCAFGLFYHVRDGALHSSVVMRSNNAFRLLPYNLFEFSLLGEVVAAELRLPLGVLSYTAMSMHVFADNYEQAREIVEDASPRAELDIPPIPFDPSPVEQVKELVRLEAEARHAAAGFSDDNFEEWLDRGEDKLNAYWRQLFYLLLLHMAERRGLQSAVDRLDAAIASPWRDYLPKGTFAAKGKKAASVGLLGEARTEVRVVLGGSEFYGKRVASLERHCAGASNPPVSFDEFVRLRTSLVGSPDQPQPQAARDLPLEVSDEDFKGALESLRKK